MIHGSVLARTSLEDAVTCDVANKMATTFLSPTEVRQDTTGHDDATLLVLIVKYFYYHGVAVPYLVCLYSCLCLLLGLHALLYTAVVL